MNTYKHDLRNGRSVILAAMGNDATNNLAGEHPDGVREMCKVYERWAKRVGITSNG